MKALIVAMCFVLVFSTGVKAQMTTNLDGDHKIVADAPNNEAGDLTVEGQFGVHKEAYFDTWVSIGTTDATVNWGGFLLSYTDKTQPVTTGEINLSISRPDGLFYFSENTALGSEFKMILNESNQLILQAPNTGIVQYFTNPGANDRIVLDPDDTNPQILINGNTVLTSAIPIASGTGGSSVQFGNSTASGIYSFASGFASTASGHYSTSMGRYNTAVGFASVAAGHSNYASGIYSVALGDQAQATGDYTIAMGWEPESTGLNSIAIGGGARATGNYSMAIGPSESEDEGDPDNVPEATANRATALGSAAKAFGESSVALGADSIAQARQSVALGYASRANGEESVALGNFATSQARGSTVMGRFNVLEGTTNQWILTDPALVVGNGTSGLNNQANGFVVKNNGETSAAKGFRTPPMGDLDMGTFITGNDPREELDPNGLYWTPPTP